MGNIINISCDVSPEITRAFLKMGMPQNIKGYNYLRVAVQYVIDHTGETVSMGTDIYERIAKEFGETSSRVERAMRHAIEVMWRRGNLEVLSRYFGCTTDPAKGQPTNSEFIFLMANTLREQDTSGALSSQVRAVREALIDEILCKYSEGYAKLLEKYKKATKGN